MLCHYFFGMDWTWFCGDPLLSLLSSETLMDSTTATAELGWTVYPVSGTSENSVSLLTHTCTHMHTHTRTQTNKHTDTPHNS